MSTCVKELFDYIQEQDEDPRQDLYEGKRREGGREGGRKGGRKGGREGGKEGMEIGGRVCLLSKLSAFSRNALSSN
jgi:hypothetical protein